MANKKVNQLTSKPAVNLTDLFLIADPTSGQAYKTTISDLGTAIGSGVSSVNGLVGAVVLDTDDIQELVSPTNKWFTDTRARAALSASSPLTYNSGTGAFGIQVANGSQNGYLSSTDWTTFNAKQAALSGTGFVKISGTTISYDNSTYLTTSAAATNYVPYTGATANVNLGLNYSLTAALIIKSGGTSTQFLKADGSIDTNTYLTISSAASTYLPLTGGTLTGDLTLSSTNPRLYFTDTDNNPDYFISNTDGTFTVYDVTNSTSRFTIGTTGNATFTNAITGGGSITGESIYSNGIVSVGTSLSVGTTITATSSVTATRLILSGGTPNTGLYFGHTDRVVLANYTTGGGIDFETNGGVINMTLFSSGNLGIGASLTDAGYKLDVDGTGRFTGALSGTSATFSGFVGIGASASYNLDVVSASDASLFQVKSTATANNTALRIGIDANTSFINATGSSTGILELRTYGTPKLTISSTGAATFSSSVTATSFNLGNGQFLRLTRNSGSLQYDALGIVAGTDNTRLLSTGDFDVVNGSLTSQFKITSSGNVGIGTSSPNSSLAISISAFSNAGLKSYTTDNVGGISAYVNSQDPYTGYLDIYATRGGDNNTLGGSIIRFLNQTTSSTASAVERMRIAAAGGVEINNTLAIGRASEGTVRLTIKAATNDVNDYAIITRDSANADLLVIRNDGYGYLKASSWAYGSDLRMKENISNVENGMEFVSKLKPKHFDYINGTKDNLGFIAQEIQEILPQAVIETQSGTLALKTDFLVPMLVKAVQELKAELDTLKNK